MYCWVLFSVNTISFYNSIFEQDFLYITITGLIRHRGAVIFWQIYIKMQLSVMTILNTFVFSIDHFLHTCSHSLGHYGWKQLKRKQQLNREKKVGPERKELFHFMKMRQGWHWVRAVTWRLTEGISRGTRWSCWQIDKQHWSYFYALSFALVAE